MKTVPNFDLETEVTDASKGRGNGIIIAGCDEAGRGPLCGPVVAAAVIFKNFDISIPVNISDSKKMTRAARASAYDWIMENCAVGVGQCNPTEIDELNILWASMLAMRRAIENLPIAADFVLVDGNRVPDGVNGRGVVKGDGKSISIAAASIVAKETRDKIMRELALQFPQYGWDKNAGYPTAAHLQAIKRHGVNQHYRKTFGPVRDLIEKEDA